MREFQLPPRMREASSWATATAALVGFATQAPPPVNLYVWLYACI
jgi:hypothetical protein